MPSLFAELESRVSNAIDGLHGEETRIVRSQKGEFFAGSANGAQADVIGIVDVNPITIKAQDEGNFDGLQATIPGEKYHVSYDLTKLAPWNFRPQPGDRIYYITKDERVSLLPIKGLTLAQVIANGAYAGFLASLLIKRVDPDGMGRIVCVCTGD